MESGSGCGGGGGRGGGGAPVPAAVGQPGPASRVSARGSTGGLGPGGVIRAARALDGVFLSCTVTAASLECRLPTHGGCRGQPRASAETKSLHNASRTPRHHEVSMRHVAPQDGDADTPPGGIYPVLQSIPRGRGCRR